MPSTSTPSREARPATAPSIARRWSPWEAITPPRRPPVPWTTKPSGGRLDLGAEAAEAVDDGLDPVGLLEAQLGGAAHHRLALGEAAEQGDERELVDGERDLGGLDGGADQRPGRDVELGDGLVGRQRRVLAARGRRPAPPPIRSRMRMKPTRVQLAAMPSITIREPGTSTAAATWKAADDGSPGHVQVAQLQLVLATQTPIRPPSRRMSTPQRSSSRSVWSRLGSGSITVVSPGGHAARRAARRT